MPIKSFDELMGEGGRSAQLSIDGGRTYTRKFLSETDDRNIGPLTILKAFGARYGDRYITGYSDSEKDLLSYVTDIAIEPHGDDGLGWVITLTYGWYDANQAGGGGDQNPLDMPIEVSWNLRDHEIVLDTDQNGNPVLNSAGDPFDPPIMLDDPRLVMTVVRNEAAFNVPIVVKYRNAVNSDQFAGFDPLTCKVLNISSRSQFHQDIGWYYQTTYEFEFISAIIDYDQTTGYRPHVLSQGFRAKSAVSGKLYHITLKGVPVNSPMLLDKNGYTTTTPYFLTFQAYPELPFAAFGFDLGAISGQRSGQNYVPTYPST